MTERTVLVTGATGNIGAAVVKLLLAERGVTVRAATRQPDAPELATDGMVPVFFDWEAPGPVDGLVAGADSVLLVPPAAHHPLPAAARILERAAATGVGHVVFVSTLGADFDPGFTFGRWALAGEEAVAASGLPFTVLRPNSFMTNFWTTLRPAADGTLRLPWGQGASSFVDPADVAEVAARVLLDPAAHLGATYRLTGPEALTVPAIAATLGEASGEPIRYLDTPPEIVRARMSDAGVPAPMVTALMELHAVMASGARSTVTEDVRRVTSRRPGSFADLAARRAREFAGASAR
jgi:uncharacterized protein YbjT (DUF2867 family)